MDEHKAKRLGEVLIGKGLISQDQLQIALTEQKLQDMPLGKILAHLGFATEAVIRDALGESLGQESIDLTNIVIDEPTLKFIPLDVARRYRVLPIAFDEGRRVLTVAMVDTLNIVAMDQINALIGSDIVLKPMLAAEAELVNAITQFYGFELSVNGIIQEIETGEIDYRSFQAETDEYSQPLVRLVDALLADAVRRSASDIHFEPESGFLRVRYRIDGVMRQIRTLHIGYWSGIAVRLKVMSGMNIAESRAPQDGRISRTFFGRSIDFRVSAQPTTHGENIVLRILDRQKGIVPLADLGLSQAALATLYLLMARPEGIILVTGPTGSGKTTTLYSMLNHINDERINIMTLEDPVEYPMSMIRQSSVNTAVKLDFANGIRSMMRQDPDVILVGEVRDEDTAEMAFRAAMTGHQVYSTLHSNSALGAIPRLLDIGIKPDIMAGNIIGVVAQRLVRKLCGDCKVARPVTDSERRLLGLEAGVAQGVILHHARGCKACDNQGYRGRLAVMEILRFTRAMDDLVVQHASRRELERHARETGFVTIGDDAIKRVLEGVTSLDEAARVVDLTERLV